MATLDMIDEADHEQPSEAFLFCAVEPDCYDEQPVEAGKKVDDGTKGVKPSSAVVKMRALWKDGTKYPVLKVYFLPKPDDAAKVAAKWGLTTDQIIKWANEWPQDENVPGFEETKRIEKADIRVKLSDDAKDGCWSKVGTKAKDVKDNGPTMVLNLGQNSKCKGESPKSLVLHEFGHALGLEHEHQRSDFWEGVKDHLNVKKMKDDHRVSTGISKAGTATFGEGWFEASKSESGIKEAIRKFLGIKKKEKTTADSKGEKQSEYDSSSIMHYGFDADWIENKEHRKMRNLLEIPDKDLPGKKYLMGIVQTNKRLADKPSKLDIETLKKAYS